jgi:hypothetical protein
MCFRKILKVFKLWQRRRLSGKELHRVAAATSKRLFPYVEVRDLGLTNVTEFSDLSERWGRCTAITSSKYCGAI